MKELERGKAETNLAFAAFLRMNVNFNFFFFFYRGKIPCCINSFAFYRSHMLYKLNSQLLIAIAMAMEAFLEYSMT